jgi:hypothetical protein
MSEPYRSPPKELSCWARFLKRIGYPSAITEWDVKTWDDPSSMPTEAWQNHVERRKQCYEETRRDLEKDIQHILQDAHEQLRTGSNSSMPAIQKCMVALMAVSVYETRKSTWWIQALTWGIAFGTLVLIILTVWLVVLELQH